MATYSFNIYSRTLTEVSIDMLQTAEILAAVREKGVLPRDLEEVRDYGKRAEEKDLLQKSASQKLESLQGEVAKSLKKINENIESIKDRRRLVLKDLKKDPSVEEEDLIFVRDLSFATPAPKRKGGKKEDPQGQQAATAPAPPAPPASEEKKEEKPAKKEKKSADQKQKEESEAQEARRLQLERMVIEITKRDKVKEAFAARDLDDAFFQKCIDLTASFQKTRQARDTAYTEWRKITAEEQEAATAQRKSWDNVRRNVIKAAKKNAAIKDLLERLAQAREQAKTGTPRKNKKK